MTFPAREITNAIHSLLMSRGYFDHVSMHEPKNAPGNGLSAASWFQSIVPLGAASSLNSTTVLAVWNIRLQTNMLSELQDEIDPNLLEALEDLLDEINGNYDLDISQVRNVDIMGAHGTPLTCEAGYIEHDKKLYRAIMIVLPLVINDCWTQVK